MGLLSRLFHRKKVKSEETSSDTLDEKIIFNREHLRIQDAGERRQYVDNCLEQIQDASRELNNLKREYNVVTSYLTDMEEIESLPKDLFQELRDTATHLQKLNDAREGFLKRDDRMTDGQFLEMEQIEDDVENGIEKLKDAERYMKLVRSDLKRLDNERHAYAYRQKEMETDQENYKGMAVITFITMLVCVVLLLGLQLFLSLNTRLGYILSICVSALMMTGLFVKFNDTKTEMEKLFKAGNKLILLQNTVKIRYVNNKHLLDYLCLKYHVTNANELEQFWKKYQEEKQEREKYENATKDYSVYQRALLQKLRMTRVKDPNLWLHQISALLDPKEMVEVRHHLIQRRQSLRGQMEYNRNIAEAAQQEIKSIVSEYPQYSNEIMEMVEQKKEDE